MSRKSIFDYINSEAIAMFIQQETANDIPYFGNTIFPAQRTEALDISWLKASDGLPVAIQPSNFDAKATLREREAFGKVETELAFFREAMRLGEADRRNLNNLLNHPQSTMVLPLVSRIYNDVLRLYRGVEAQAEIMRMQLIQSGTITVTGVNSGASYKYDYKMQNISTADKAWSDPEADIIGDIISIQDQIEEETGVRPTRLVMNRNTMLMMIKNPTLQGLLLPMWTADQVARALITEDQVKQFVETTTGCQIFVYNKKVAKLGKDGKQGDTVKLIEDGNVIFLPEGTVGHTWYGITPEEADLMSGESIAQVSLVGNGVAITTYKEPHPVNVNTVVSAVMVPSFEGINDVAVLRVGGAQTLSAKVGEVKEAPKKKK